MKIEIGFSSSFKRVFKKRIRGNEKYLFLITFILENITRKLTHKLVVYSPNICRQFKLEKYNHKVIIAHRHFIDFNLFKVRKEN